MGRSDLGRYTCEAENTVGRAQASLLLSGIITTRTRSPVLKIIKLILEGKATCRLHRKSPKKYSAIIIYVGERERVQYLSMDIGEIFSEPVF